MGWGRVLKYKKAAQLAEGRVKVLYAKWYEVVIVIFVLLWVIGQVGGQGAGY